MTCTRHAGIKRVPGAQNRSGAYGPYDASLLHTPLARSGEPLEVRLGEAYGRLFRDDWFKAY